MSILSSFRFLTVQQAQLIFLPIVWLHLMQSIFDAMKEFQRGVWRAVYLTEEDLRTLFVHHAAIVTAIRSRDAEAAREAMMRHLTFAEQRSTAYVARTPS